MGVLPSSIVSEKTSTLLVFAVKTSGAMVATSHSTLGPPTTGFTQCTFPIPLFPCRIAPVTSAAGMEPKLIPNWGGFPQGLLISHTKKEFDTTFKVLGGVTTTFLMYAFCRPLKAPDGNAGKSTTKISAPLLLLDEAGAVLVVAAVIRPPPAVALALYEGFMKPL